MSGRSDVYLVSNKPFADNETKKGAFDNPGFQSTDKQVVYNPSSGVDIPRDTRMPDKPYRGMGKEDLLHFSSQPFWRRLRMICVAMVVLGWLALIITVIALVLVYPKCRDPGSRSWWQTESMYRIYVPSFKDSDDDGIGDLKGIETELDYIKDLEIGVLSLSPFYSAVDTAASQTAKFASGNDIAITNHSNVGLLYGTLADFDSLIATAHDKGLYVVVDFIPKHTSKEHEWFVNSRISKTNSRRNFYVWSDGNSSIEVPNNWRSHYNTDAWTNDTSRNQYYLHQYHSDTPDLNLRSAQVQQELEDILTFWLDRGVDGFNIRDTAYLYEDYDLRDEPLKTDTTPGSSKYDDYDHIYTSNQPEIFGMINRWRSLLRAHNKTTTEKLLLADIQGEIDVMQLYGDCDSSGIQMPLNSMFADENSSTCDGACIAKYVDGWMSKIPSGKWANWVMGDENTVRMASRFNASFIQAFTVMTMLLPGTPVMYYGNEINMADSAVNTNASERQQPMRSIMVWDNSTNVGFCNNSCKAWTTFGNPATGNVNMGSSLIDMIKSLSELRKKQSFVVGEYIPALRDNNVFSFVREFEGETGYLVAINFGPNTESRDFSKSHDTISSASVVAFVNGASYAEDDDIDPSSVELGPYGAVVLSWDYVPKEL